MYAGLIESILYCLENKNESFFLIEIKQLAADLKRNLKLAT